MIVGIFLILSTVRLVTKYVGYGCYIKSCTASVIFKIKNLKTGHRDTNDAAHSCRLNQDVYFPIFDQSVYI